MLLSLTIDLLNPMAVGLAADGCEKNWWNWVGVEFDPHGSAMANVDGK
jgi:hypothetical protein